MAELLIIKPVTHERRFISMDRTYRNNVSRCDDKCDEEILRGLKDLMIQGQHLTSDMIRTLHHQVFTMRRELSRKQFIIDSLLRDAYGLYSEDIIAARYTATDEEYALSSKLMDVKNTIKADISRSVVSKQMHDEKFDDIHIKLRPRISVVGLLEEIKELVAAKACSPDKKNGATSPRKVYRIKFNRNGESVTSCVNLQDGSTSVPYETCMVRFNTGCKRFDKVSYI